MNRLNAQTLQNWRADGLIDWEFTAVCLNVFKFHPQNTPTPLVFGTVIFCLISCIFAVTFMAMDGPALFIHASLMAFCGSAMVMVLLFLHALLHSYAQKHLSLMLWRWSEDFNPHDFMKDCVTLRLEPLLRLLEGIRADPEMHPDWSKTYEFNLLMLARQQVLWPSTKLNYSPQRKFTKATEFMFKNALQIVGGFYPKQTYLHELLSAQQKERFFQVIAPACYAQELSHQMHQLCTPLDPEQNPRQRLQTARL